MAIPDFQTLMRPVLEYISATGEEQLKDIYEEWAAHC